MAWKDLPAWLKGGIIGLGIILSVFVINLLLDAFVYSRWPPFTKEWGMFYFFIASLPLMGLARILDNPPLTGLTSAWVYSLIVFIFYFLIGAVIGWIVGKIKRQ